MEDKEKWPGIEHAYAFVLPSYQWMLTRFEAADSRIQTLVVLIATVSLGIPAVLTLVASVFKQVPTHLPLVFWALGLGALAIIIGLVARNIGGVMLVSPEVLWRKWTRLQDWKFKSRMLDYSARHFERNRKVISLKAWMTLAMTGLFLCEVTLLLVWLYRVVVAAAGTGLPVSGGHP